MCWVTLVHFTRSLSEIPQTLIELSWTLTLKLRLCMAACDASISAYFVLDSRASVHANTHDLLVRDARIKAQIQMESDTIGT